MPRRFGIGSLAFFSALVFSTTAFGHVRLTYPTPRYPDPPPGGDADADIKEGPCGNTGDSRTTDESRITTLEAGSTITVEFRETVPHPGWFRIAFDDDGQDDLPPPPTSSTPPTSAVPPILKDGIMDGTRNMPYTAEITLPNTPCDNCTLQLIQVMTDRNGNPSYYNCADIILTAPTGSGGAGGTGGTDAGGTGGSTAGESQGGGGSGGAPGGNGGGGTGGSATGGGGASAGSGTSGSGGSTGGATAGTGGTGTTGSGGVSGASGTTGTAGTAPSAGTGGAGGTGSPATGGAAGTTTQPTAGTTAAEVNEPEDDGGCSVAGSKHKGSGLALLGLGLIAGLSARRRARRRAR